MKSRRNLFKRALSVILALVMTMGLGGFSVMAEEGADTAAEKEASGFEDGVYRVTVNLWHSSQNQQSMGNSAIRGSSAYNERHAEDDPSYQALLVVKNGEGTVIMESMAMGFLGTYGYLLELDSITVTEYNQWGYPSEYTENPAMVLAEHRMTDGSIAKDLYNDPDSESVLEVANGKAYPHIMALSVELPDQPVTQAWNEAPYVHVFVPVMYSISPSSGDQLAHLILDYTNMTKVEDLSGEVEYWLYEAMITERGTATDEAWQALQDVITETKEKLSDTLVSLELSGSSTAPTPVRHTEEMDEQERQARVSRLKTAIEEVVLPGGDTEEGWDGVTVKEPARELSSVYVAGAEELAWVAAQVNAGTADFTMVFLQNDIDLNGKEWTPIGTEEHPFTGTFEGNACTVSGLSVTQTSNCSGLFGNVAGSEDTKAVVRNLTVEGTVSVANGGNVGSCIGGVIGRASHARISGCTSNVAVNNESTYFISTESIGTGGIVGNASDSELTSCTNNGSVTSGRSRTGGIAGMLIDTNVSECLNQGTVSGTGSRGGYAGGIAGGVSSTSGILYFSRCVNLGNVTGGSSNVGGIAGHLVTQNASSGFVMLDHVYNRGSVSGTSATGGLVGCAAGYMSNVMQGYSTGTVTCQSASTGAALVGQVMATNIGNIADLYALEGTHEKLYNTSSGLSGSDVSFQTEEWLKSDAALTALNTTSTEHFVKDTKEINDGYPVLQFQNEPTLEEYRTAAIEEIYAYKNADDYAGLSGDAIRNIQDSAAGLIGTALTKTEIDGLVEAAKGQMDGIPNDVNYGLDLEAFQKALGEAETILEAGNEQYKYTEDSWAALQSAVEEAKSLQANGFGSQSKADAAAKSITDAIAALAEFVLPFTDVEEGIWFYDAVKFVYLRGIMTGTNPQEMIFSPYQNLARAQITMILYRMEGEPDTGLESSFPDVSVNDWYGPAIIWADHTGIATGYSNGYFGPADYVTREQMAVMMYRYAVMKGFDVTASADISQYEDAGRVSDFAETAMKWAVAEGIITGKYNQTQLDPQGTASRAECAVIIMRFMTANGLA